MVVEICEYLKIDIFYYLGFFFLVFLPCQNLTHIEENSND